MSPSIGPEEPRGTGVELAPRSRLSLVVLWCSFLSASIATTVFFAFVDPAPIIAVLTPTGALPGRTALYSLGFLFFWLVCALASALTAWLVSTPPSMPPTSRR